MTQAAERLTSVQKRLVAQGAIDIKLCFHEDAARRPLEDVQNSVADVLEAYLDGKHTPMQPLNDRDLA